MKRTIPAIVVLITVSLLGLIYFQVTWLQNLLELRQEQINEKVNEASCKVAIEIIEEIETKPLLRMPKKMGFGRLGHISLSKPLSVEDKFDEAEIQNMLRKSFDSAGLRFLKFEFAITNSTGEFEMHSPNFAKEYPDTVNNKIKWVAISQSENPTDNLKMGQYENIAVVVPDFIKQVQGSLIWFVFASAIFLVIIVSAFFITLHALIAQKKVSEIKNDFINNMTHELKTPLATISLAVSALQNEKIWTNREKSQYFTGIIKDENKKLNGHVETILNAAVSEKQKMNVNFTEVDVHPIIKKVVDGFSLQLTDKKGKVELLLNASPNTIMADEPHFINMISNLVDNAIKYSNENLVINISTSAYKDSLTIKIADNGIGMSRETVKKIFEKFYRAHTGNVHNVKGFGLGMSYVKSVVDAHKGKIKVDSTLGKGSVFTIELPLANINPIKG